MATCDVEIVQPEIDVSQQAVALIDDTIDASVGTIDPIIQVDAEEYVLSSGGMYGGNGLIGAVPDWILKAVEQQLTTGDGNLMSVLQDLQALMTSFQIGVNQQIASLNTDMYSQNGIITTISSQVEQNRADAIDLIATKATPEYALAVATDAINTRFANEFGGVSAEAFIGNIASTYVDANSAIAQEVDLVKSSYNDTTVKIEDLRQVAVGTFSEWNGTDIPQLGQFMKDANGVWYQYLGELEGWVITNMAHSLASTSYIDAELIKFANIVNGSLGDLQSQIDGEITSWYYSYAPSQDKEPWSTWIADDTASGTTVSQDQHTGDLFYDLTNEVAYRFSKSAGVFGWGIISDDIIIKALADASKAQDTADGKRSVFYSDTVPVARVINGTTIPFSDGDLWIPSVNVSTYVAGEVYAYVAGHNPVWVLATRYTSAINSVLQEFTDWQPEVYSPYIASAQAQIDKKTETFYQASVPTGRITSINVADNATLNAYVGDLWKNTYAGTISGFLGNNTEYIYTKQANGSNWNYTWTEMQVPDLVFDEIDTKRQVFVATPIPPYDIGDLWVGGPTGDVKKCKIAKAAGTSYAAGDWELASKYTDDTAALRTVRMFTAVNASVPTAEGIGDLWSVSDRWYTNVTGTTERNTQTTNGLVLRRWNGSAWITIAREVKSTYASVAWAATASSIIRDPISDAITGWSYADGSGTQSQFGIHADNFYIKNSSYGARPFEINGSDIIFRGKVSFNSVTNTPVINKTFVQTTAPTSGMVAGDTWLDSDGGYAVYTYSGSSWVAGGSKTYSQTSAPTSGMVAGDLWVDTDDNNKLYRYNGTSWVNQTITSGGIISAINGTTNTTTIDGGKLTAGTVTADAISATAISGKFITGGEISGATINGANINGSVIKSSWIDYSTTGDLTNWQFYTPATIPTAYAANFAHNNKTGALIVDSLGYVRLPGKSNFNTGVYTQSSGTSLTAYVVPIYSYNNYITTSTSRAINNTANIILLSDYTAPIVQAIQDLGSGTYGTSVMTGSVSIFGDIVQWSFKSEYPSAYTLYYTTWIKVNGTFIYNPGRLRADGSYPYYPTTQRSAYGFLYTIAFNNIPGTNNIGVVVKYVNQTNTVTGQGNGELKLISNSKTGSNFPTTLSVNFPLMQIT